MIIDNFDSFTNNLAAQVFAATGESPVVVRNTCAYGDLPLQGVAGVIISPGPGRSSIPADFGVCREVIERCERPILGVCLGHQGIAEVFGGQVSHAPEPMHGRASDITHDGQGLFAGLPSPLRVIRYHSLVVTDVPTELVVTARTDDGLVMALQHRQLPMWGVQFHPESIGTEHGQTIIDTFVQFATTWVSPPAPPLTVAAAVTAAGGNLDVLPVREVPWPTDLLRHFAHHYAAYPTAFWLDAELSMHPHALYSVMGGSPHDVLLRYDVTSRTLRITASRDAHVNTYTVTGNFFDLIGELLDAAASTEPVGLNANGPPAELCFRRGLVGYLGYELKSQCDGAQVHRADTPDAALVWPAHFMVLDHRQGRAWQVGTAPDPISPVPAGPGTADLPPFRPGPVPAEHLTLAKDEHAYLRAIHDIQRLIADGESYEVCLTNRLQLPAPADPLVAYALMRQASPVPFGAYLSVPECTVLSASPECFLTITEQGLITTAPIKGTRSRGGTPRRDARLRSELAASEKDQAENLMIVDLARHDLNGVCLPGSVQVPRLCEVQSFSSVHQLVSTVQGRLRPHTRAVDAIRACFPPGSMTGAPKVRTMDIIDDVEGGARGVYSGAIGWIDVSGVVRLSVAIRTVVVANGVATSGIGGAITALSNPEAEWTETLVKASVPWYVCGCPKTGPAVEPVLGSPADTPPMTSLQNQAPHR